MTHRPAPDRGPEAPGVRLRDDTTREVVAALFRRSGFRRFFTARAVSQIGDGIFQIAAADVLLFDDPGPNPVLKLFALTAIVLIPFSVISPFSGVFIDRWERRTILTRVPLLRAVVAALLPVAGMLGTDSPAFFTVVLVVLSANRFFLATMSAVLPQLVDEEDLLVANSVSSTGGSVANVTGLVIGAALAGLLGGTIAATFAAIAFVASAITAARVPVHRGLPPHRAPLIEELIEVLQQLKEGLVAVRRDRRVMYGLSAISVVQLLVGATTGALYFAFIVLLDLPIGAATGVLALLAAGIGIGIVFVPFVGRRIRHDRLIPIGFVIAAFGVFLAAAGDVSRARLTVGTFFVGLAYAFAKIPVDTIVQEEMEDRIRGRAFAAYDMLFNAARVVGIGLVAWAYQIEATTRGLIAAIGTVYLLAAAGSWIWERRLQRSGPPRRADLLRAGEMVTVRAYAGYRADEEPRAIVVGGSELPVEGIEWRAVVEEGGRRSRVFVVRIGGRRVRLAYHEDDDTGWEIERIMGTPVVDEPR